MPVMAIVTILAARIDPFRRDPLRDAIAKAELWCSFDLTNANDLLYSGDSKAEMVREMARSGGIAVSCLLKLGESGVVRCDVQGR